MRGKKHTQMLITIFQPTQKDESESMNESESPVLTWEVALPDSLRLPYYQKFSHQIEFRHQVVHSNIGHQVAPLVLPHCLGLPPLSASSVSIELVAASVS